MLKIENEIFSSGTHPFRGRTAFELSSAILREIATPLPARAPSSLSAIILRCLEKSADDRSQQSNEVHCALEALNRDADYWNGSVVPADEKVGAKFASPTSEFLLFSRLKTPEASQAWNI